MSLFLINTLPQTNLHVFRRPIATLYLRTLKLVRLVSLPAHILSVYISVLTDRKKLKAASLGYPTKLRTLNINFRRNCSVDSSVEMEGAYTTRQNGNLLSLFSFLFWKESKLEISGNK